MNSAAPSSTHFSTSQSARPPFSDPHAAATCHCQPRSGTCKHTQGAGIGLAACLGHALKAACYRKGEGRE